LSEGMRQLNGVYTQRSNRAHGRSGHVFQGRFKAILVDEDAYLLEVSRYVALNPVRAGLVSEAGEWHWSSYRATAGEVGSPKWLKAGALLRLLHLGRTRADKARAQALWVDHVRAGVGLPPIWDALQNQVFLGSPAFVQRMNDMANARMKALEGNAWREVPRQQRLAPKRSLESFAADHRESRNAAIAAAYASGHYSMAAVAQHFGVHYATVSRVVNAAQAPVKARESSQDATEKMAIDDDETATLG
jgi:putative transposase